MRRSSLYRVSQKFGIAPVPLSVLESDLPLKGIITTSSWQQIIPALSLPVPFCHRLLFAACSEEQTGEVIEEVRGGAHGDVGYGEREGG